MKTLKTKFQSVFLRFSTFNMPSTTPLLLLLDSVLCQDREQLDNAMQQVRTLVDVPISLSNLSEVVHALLEDNPQFASVTSEHDKSLPLHFAASVGDIRVAEILIAKVSYSYPLS